MRVTRRSDDAAIPSAALVEAARHRDEDAWRGIFDHFYPPLYRLFRSRAGTDTEAQDLAGDVLLEAFRSITSFDPQRQSLEAWLFGIARHQLTSDRTVRDEFLDARIRAILERLPPTYRTALELRFVVGLSSVATAALMGTTHGAFRSLLLRATSAFERASSPTLAGVLSAAVEHDDDRTGRGPRDGAP